jgi:hypothetical protein
MGTTALLTQGSLGSLPVAAKVVAPVSYRMPGNGIEHVPVGFDVFQAGNRFKAIPQCSEEVMRLTRLPERISFEVIKGRIINASSGVKDIAQDFLKAMASQFLLRLP